MNHKAQDETTKDRIIALLRKGYRRSQLINDLDFAERTVDAAIRAHKELNNGSTEEPEENDGAITDNGTTAPPIHKGTAKATGESPRGGSLAIRKDKESVLPEWLGRDVAEIFDGQTRDQKKFLAGVSVPLMGLRLFTEVVKPMIELLTVWQAGQAEAARAAQGSGTEIAEAATAGAAARAIVHIDDKFNQLKVQKPDIASVPDPMKGFMARTMELLMNQVMGQMFGGQVGGTPGFADNRGQGRRISRYHARLG